MTKLELLQTGSAWRPKAFRNVIASVTVLDCQGAKKVEEFELQIPGTCFSEYQSGPGPFLLSDVVAELLSGKKGGMVFVGLKSCEYVGWYGEITAA